MSAVSRSFTIAVTDYWKDVDPRTDPIVRLLTETLGGTLVDDPADADLVLFSVFGRRNGIARGLRLGYSGEPRLALGGDWTIDWRFTGSQRHVRFPYWAHHLLHFHFPPVVPPQAFPQKFCNFVYSNSACGMRNAFFTMLDRERHVDAPGRVFNNMHSEVVGARTDAAWPLRKLEYLADYRFTIAFENEEHVGYTTEKIVDAWLAGSVPIYWGNPAIEADFPAGSYLSYYQAGSLGALVRDVITLDDDPTRYRAIADSNPLRTGVLQEQLDACVTALADFAAAVVADAIAGAGSQRRSLAVRSAAQLMVTSAELRRQLVRLLHR